MPEELKSQNFVVTRRPRLAEVVEHPKMDFADYERRLTSLQGVLQLIQQAYLGTSERALLVLEGWDTAGKGGVVRRLGWALDPRSFKVHPIAAPDEHERAQHYLQRFWRRLPEKGQIEDHRLTVRSYEARPQPSVYKTLRRERFIYPWLQRLNAAPEKGGACRALRRQFHHRAAGRG